MSRYSRKRIVMYLGGYVFVPLLLFALNSSPTIRHFYGTRLGLIFFLFLIPLSTFCAAWILIESRSWLVGEGSEYRINKELKKLPRGFTIIQNIEFNNEDIDIVVVGSTGLWIVEVKSTWPGYLRLDWVNQSHRQFNYIQTLFPKIISQRVIVTDSWNAPHFGQKKQHGIYVVGWQWLVQLLSTGRNQLSSTEVKHIAEVLKQMST